MGKKLISVVTGFINLIITVMFLVSMIMGVLFGIWIAKRYNNYLLLSYSIYIWIRMMTDVFFNNNRNRITMFLLNRYPYCIKSLYRILAIITFVLSSKFFISFICFIIITYFGTKFNKQLNEIKREKNMEVF